MAILDGYVRKEIRTLDATPKKRIFYSIIADYDMNRSICELVDNALDVWVRGQKSKTIRIDINLDDTQQTITVSDNAGGVPDSDLEYIVGPGETGTMPTDQTIGIFGVGTKRAVVALAQNIRIMTRYPGEKGHQIAFDDDWLFNDDSWLLPVAEVDSIQEGKTVVELQKLRIAITKTGIEQLREHLEATYANFIANDDVTIRLNDKRLKPQFFTSWAYPPNYAPRNYIGDLPTEHGIVKVDVTAGLSTESSPATGEYGVYFYCNDRLIARALKSFEVGFMKGFAGQPHPKVSLTRVLISLRGDARDMPWNSSKSDINGQHPVFDALHEWLLQVVKDYATLSRNWMGDWPDKVFRYKTGEIVRVPISDFPSVRKSYLPPPPKSRPRYLDIVEQKNKNVGKDKPWTKGLYESIIAADSVGKLKRLEQKNRVTLIILDSTLEIAFKEFLVNEQTKHYYTDSDLLNVFRTRNTVKTEIKKYVKISQKVWKKITFYADLRNKLIHQRSTAGPSDEQINDYREVVENVLKKLFKLKLDAD